MELVWILTRMEKDNDKAFMEMIWTKILEGVYLNYKTDNDFMEQFERIAQGIFSVMQVFIAGKGGSENGSDTV